MAKLKYGKQNFHTMQVEIHIDEEVVFCNMFQDHDGDLGFIYGGRYYFRYCERITTK